MNDETTEIELGDIPDTYAGHHGEKLAVVYAEGESLTWRELARRSLHRAHQLKGAGVRQGDIVTLALSNSCSYYEHSFAIWKLGATPNFVSPRLAAHELSAIISLACPRVVIAEAPLHSSLACFLLPDSPVPPSQPQAIPSRHPDFWKAATSGGSTGMPKIIVDRLPFRARSLNAPQPYTSLLSPGPLYHNAPFAGTHKALALGCTVYGTRRFDAETTLALIATHRIEWVHLVPTMMHRIWALPDEVKRRYDISSVSMFWHYGAPIAAWLKQRWIDWVGPDRVSEFYGSTEYLGATAISGREWQDRHGSVGRIQGQSRMKALREDGSECAPGEIGEIYFLPPDPASRPYHYLGGKSRGLVEGWESVGDMGHIDDEGYLFLADRRVDMIIKGGANIYPAELEAALEAFPGVLAGVVVGLRHADLGEVPHAIVQVADVELFKASSLDSLKIHLREHLSADKLPSTLELVEERLKDDAGKFRRIAVRDERRAWVEQSLHTERFLPLVRK